MPGEESKEEDYLILAKLEHASARCAVLRFILSSSRGIGSRDVAVATGMQQSNAVRALVQLEALGVVRKQTGDLKWNRKYLVTELGRRAGRILVEAGVS